MPIDRSAIDGQLREIGEGERWWEQREFRDLPYILHADEHIQGITNGKLLGRRRPRIPAGAWLFVVTDQRLLCLKQERFARKQVEIPAGQIIDVQQSSRLRSYQITIRTAQRRYRIRIAKAEAFRFAGALAPLIPNPRAQRLDPAIEAWSWIPGMTTVSALPGVSGIMSRVSMLSPPDYATQHQVDRLEQTVERLVGEVERLQQQVGFLEELLENRPALNLLPNAGTEEAPGPGTAPHTK